MKQIIFTAVLLFAFCFAAFAQTNGMPFNTPDKIAAIHSYFLFFEEKSGIKVLADAYRKIDDELKAERAQLDVLSVISQNLKKQLESLQISPTLFRYKLDELLSTQREYNFRAEAISILPGKRKIDLMNIFKVREALTQFMKQNGYAIILDKTEMRDTSMIIEGNQKIPDVTLDFVKFFNDKYAKTNSL